MPHWWRRRFARRRRGRQTGRRWWRGCRTKRRGSRAKPRRRRLLREKIIEDVEIRSALVTHDAVILLKCRILAQVNCQSVQPCPSCTSDSLRGPAHPEPATPKKTVASCVRRTLHLSLAVGEGQITTFSRRDGCELRASPRSRMRGSPHADQSKLPGRVGSWPRKSGN